MRQTVGIPFVDLLAPHQELGAELLAVFQEALETSRFVGGPAVEQFERQFAAYCQTPYCVGVSSGTSALHFALVAAGVEAGDLVLTVPHTFIATSEAILQAGAQPQFIDIHPDTQTLDPERLRNFLESECIFDQRGFKTIHRDSGRAVTALVPVHLYGQVADMDPIIELAGRFNLAVVEDACQAHGAEYYSKSRGEWLKAGSIGRAAAFSFYPGKNLGACGDAGAVTTQDGDVAARVRMLRDHGQSGKYRHECHGTNGRLDSIQAGILSVKLPYLTDWNRQRQEIADRYRELLDRLAGSVVSPAALPWCRHNFHLFVIRTSFRDRLREHLTRAGVETGIHYPVPIHLQPAYESFGWKRGDFPISERLAAQALSLPMYPGLREEHQRCVVDAIEECLDALPIRSHLWQSC